MTKRPFDEAMKAEMRRERILCISYNENSDYYIRRIFTTEEKALEAEKKLVEVHGKLIATWVRPPSKDETVSMYWSKCDWCKVVDDDSCLPVVVDVKHKYFDITSPGAVRSRPTECFTVRADDAAELCMKLEEIQKVKWNTDSNSRVFIIRNAMRLANDTDLIETIEQALERFNKS